MEISARVVADSIAPCGARVITQVWKVPRPIQAEINTHRMLTRSSASSRAIPQAKMIKRITENPFIPRVWGINQSGMQASTALEGAEAEAATVEWLRIRDVMIEEAQKFQKRFNLHKQIVNRLTEAWMMTEIIITATDLDNVWGLRCHPAAEPHFEAVARAARTAMDESTPRVLSAGEWHLPFIDFDDEVDGTIAPEDLFKVSMARCARVSYLNHDGKRDPASDLALFEKLIGGDPKHAAPSEHVAQALDWPKWYPSTVESLATAGPWPMPGTVYDLRERVVAARRERAEKQRAPTQNHMFDEAALGELQSGNFLGFRQFRKTLENENIGGLMP